jgi:uncharacterized lipoprotein YmbA
VIRLNEVAIAGYLKRQQIVRSSEDVRLDVLKDDLWAEQLDPMLTRILAEELTVRLPDTTVFTEGGVISGNAGSTVGVDIQRLDADHSGAVILLAQIAVTGHNADMRDVRLTVPPPAPGTPGLVNAMSSVTAQLADAIADIVAPPGTHRREPAEVRRLKKRVARLQMERDTLKRAVDRLSDVTN